MSSSERVVKRKLSNLLLRPLLQTKIGLYFIGLSILLAASLMAMIYFHFSDLLVAIIELTDASEEIHEILNAYWTSIKFWIYSILILYIVITVLISVWYTHRFVGPAVAFHKHLSSISKGDYSFRTYLRRGDAFEEIADALNQASEALDQVRLSKLSDSAKLESNAVESPKVENGSGANQND
ncbi:MAG: hypothetical protein ACOH5I_22355 [Oligoflexus sp.]